MQWGWGGMGFDWRHPRGFLQNYPADVVAILNGKPITKGMLLDVKRDRQRRRLATILKPVEPLVYPAFIWTFHNDSWLYSGWWLYVKTAYRSWQISVGRRHGQFILPIMRLYPCGLLPIAENFSIWKQTFARVYVRKTHTRHLNQGMALVRAKVSPTGPTGDLLEVLPW